MRHFPVRGILGHLTIRTLGSGNPHLTVNVQASVLTTRTPHSALSAQIIAGKIVLVDWAIEGGLTGDIVSLSGKVVVGLLEALDAAIELDISAVCGGDDRVLPALRVVQTKVDLTVAARASNGELGSEDCDKIIIDKGEGLLVIRDISREGSTWATAATIGQGLDVDIGRIWTIALGRNGLGDRGLFRHFDNERGRGGERSQEKSSGSEKRVHYRRCRVKVQVD